MDFEIVKANREDMEEILELQYLAYQSEAALFGSRDIPPLKETLEEVYKEYDEGLVLKMKCGSKIIGSVRAREQDGKLMVHPDYQKRGFGKRLLLEVENYFPGKRYELFTSTRSTDNIRLYKSVGYKEFDQKAVNEELVFVYMEKV